MYLFLSWSTCSNSLLKTLLFDQECRPAISVATGAPTLNGPGTIPTLPAIVWSGHHPRAKGVPR